MNPWGTAAQTRLGPVTFPSAQFADTDNILTNSQTLRLLIEQRLPVVAPMLDSQTYYSNFWCGITPQVRPGSGASGGLRSERRDVERLKALGSVGPGRGAVCWGWRGALSQPGATPSPGLLPPHSRLLPYQEPPAPGLLPCPHGPLHLPGIPAGGGDRTAWLLPPSPQLYLALRRHHHLRLRLSGCW